MKEHYFSTSGAFQRDTDVIFTTDDPKNEFLQALRKKIHGAEANPYDYRAGASADMVAAFERLEKNPGVHNSYMPQVSFLNVVGDQRDEVYTIIRNSAYLNVAQPFKEEERRLPEEDTLTVVRGFIGAYPNNFFQVNEKQLPKFVEQIISTKGPKDRDRIRNLYTVRRNAPWFWRLSDKFHQMYKEKDGIAAGIFDYNRYHYELKSLAIH